MKGLKRDIGKTGRGRLGNNSEKGLGISGAQIESPVGLDGVALAWRKRSYGGREREREIGNRVFSLGQQHRGRCWGPPSGHPSEK